MLLQAPHSSFAASLDFQFDVEFLVKREDMKNLQFFIRVEFYVLKLNTLLGSGKSKYKTKKCQVLFQLIGEEQRGPNFRIIPTYQLSAVYPRQELKTWVYVYVHPML